MSNEAIASDYIKQVTESGTAYQRIILLATSVAHWAYTNEPIEPPLTPQEHAKLQASFRTEGDKRVLEKYRNVDSLVKLYIVQLSQYLVEHDLILAHIRHLNSERIMLNVTVPEFCDVIGNAIAERFGRKAQIEIFREVSKHKLSRIFGSKTTLEVLTDQETGESRATFSFPDFSLPDTAKEIENLAGEEYFLNSLVAYGRRLSQTRRIAKANIEALQAVMKAERFNIKPYKHFLKRAEKRLRNEPPLTVLSTTEELRQEEATATDKEMKRIYKDLINEQEEKRSLFWQTYDEIEVTDEDTAPFRSVFQANGVAYAKS